MPHFFPLKRPPLPPRASSPSGISGGFISRPKICVNKSPAAGQGVGVSLRSSRSCHVRKMLHHVYFKICESNSIILRVYIYVCIHIYTLLYIYFKTFKIYSLIQLKILNVLYST